jgi:MFS family permease
VNRPPRSVSAVLRDRTVALFFGGKVVSSCGIWIQNVAAAVFMFELTGSALMVGTVSMVQFVAPLLLAIWAGALGDWMNRRKLLMLGRLISGGAVATLTLLLMMRGVDGFGGARVLLLTVLVMGVGLALSIPAMHALIPALVPPDDLETALALNAAAPSIARTVGPALGAGLLVVGGPALAFGVAAASHLFFAVVLAIIRPRDVSRPSSRPDVLGGVRYVLANRDVGLFLLGVGALGLGSDAVVTLAPSLAAELGGGAGLVGIIASMFGVGSGILTIALPRLRSRVGLRSLGFAGFWLLGAGLSAAAVARSSVPAVAGMTLAGGGFMLATVALTTMIQRQIPEDLRSRVMALWGVAFIGSRPFAALVNGSLAEFSSVRIALGIAAILTVLSAPLAGRTRSADS